MIFIGFNWIKFWHVGEHLRMFSKNEEYQITAVGRYYQTCFLLARDIYKKRNKKTLKGPSVHQNLIDEFKISKSDTDRKIGIKLNELRDLRNNADYDENFNMKNVNFTKFKSKELLNIMEKIKDK